MPLALLDVDNTAPKTHSTLRLSEKLPDTPALSGISDVSWEAWKIQMLDKLIANHNRFNTDQQQIAYKCNRLQGDALQHVLARRQSLGAISFENAQEILDMPELSYGDRNRTHKARVAYQQLYMQKDESFATFFSEFYRLSIYLDMTEKTMMSDLENKITTKHQA